MTYPRVNLLKKDERRYQGAVSRSFILVCGIGTPILLIFLIIGLCFVQKFSIESQLKSSQALWDNLEPSLKAHNLGNQGLTTNKKVLDLFNGWESSQTSFVNLLSDLQDSVPGSIQFNRLSVRTGESKAIYKTPAELEMDYTLTLEGIALGAQAEKQVIAFQKDLLACEQVGSTFESLKLDSMRKRTDANGEHMSEFRLLGAADEGGMK